MANILYVLCKVSEGLRPSDRTVEIPTYQGRLEFLRVNDDYLLKEGGQTYLPVAHIRTDLTTGAALVQLPMEADSGTHRVWIAKENILVTEEAAP